MFHFCPSFFDIFLVFRPGTLLTAFIFHQSFTLPMRNMKWIGRTSSPRTRRMWCGLGSIRQRWLRSSGTWRCVTWQCAPRMLHMLTDEGTHISGVTGSSPSTLSLASENRKAVLTSRARVVRVSLYVSLRGNFRASLTTVALPHTRAFHPLILPLPESRALIQVTESRVFAPSATGRVCHIDTGRSQRGHCVASWLGASDDQSGSGVRSSLLKGLNGARGENVITPRI